MDPKVALMLETENNNRPLWWGLGVAVAVHLVVLFLPIARTQAAPPPEKTETGETITLHPFRLPPAKPKPTPPTPHEVNPPSVMPMPDPEPDSMEPVEVPELITIPTFEISDFIEDFVDVDFNPPAQAGPAIPVQPIGPVGSHNLGVNQLVLLTHVEPKIRSVFPRAKVVVSVVIGTDGIIRESRVLSATTPEHGQAVLNVLPQWRYKPARLNGKLISVSHRITVKFEDQS